MGTKRASVSWSGAALRFDGVTGSGHHIVLGTEATDAGPRPMELLMSSADPALTTASRR